MRKFMAMALVATSCVTLADNVDGGLVKQDANRQWHFRIGPVMAPRVRAKITGPRAIIPVQVPAGSSSTSGTGANVPDDPSAGYADRQYADGYVKPDEGTADPDSIIAGLTWDWGADDVSSQYSSGSMEFRTEMSRWTETTSFSSESAGAYSDGDRDILMGVEAVGGWMFYEGEKSDASIDAGFRFYGSGDLSAASRYGTTVTTTRHEYRYVDSYDAFGWTDVPGGSYEGSPEGPGRVIGATPTRREELMGAYNSSETYYYNAATKLNYNIWDLRLGPTMGWKVTNYLTLRGGVYGLLGLVDAELKTSVNTSSGAVNSKSSKCEPVFGVAAGLSAQINLTDNVFIVGSAEYDWWSDRVALKSGGADARIELSDFTVSLSVGIEF